MSLHVAISIAKSASNKSNKIKRDMSVGAPLSTEQLTFTCHARNKYVQISSLFQRRLEHFISEHSLGSA